MELIFSSFYLHKQNIRFNSIKWFNSISFKERKRLFKAYYPRFSFVFISGNMVDHIYISENYQYLHKK